MKGSKRCKKGRADVILVNMQYSPRTDIIVALGPYADVMRVAAQQHEIPLFDRLSIMRHWSDTGAFDLYAAGKDNLLALRVHDCIARAMADMIIDEDICPMASTKPRSEGQKYFRIKSIMQDQVIFCRTAIAARLRQRQFFCRGRSRHRSRVRVGSVACCWRVSAASFEPDLTRLRSVW